MLEFKFQPFPILETKRMILRKLGKADMNEIFILRTDPEVIKYIDRTPPTEVKELKREKDSEITLLQQQIQVLNGQVAQQIIMQLQIDGLKKQIDDLSS